MSRYFIVAIILFLMVSCDKNDKKLVDVSKINVEVNIDRFDQQFYNSTIENLPDIKAKFPYLFPANNPDSVWVNKIKNDQELFNKASKVFGDFSSEKNDLEKLFKHVKYYHPAFKEPKLITLITNLDYRSKVIYADSLLLVSLDMYLGESDEVYNDFPKYLSKNYKKEQLKIDVAKEIANRYAVPERNRQFLTTLINEGKKIYLLESYLPAIEKHTILEYSKEEYDWAALNELMIWKFFIENKLLFSTDSGLYERFIANAPFSKFYIEIDKESPGRIGVFIGWKIVEAYMNNNNVTLHQLLQTNADTIFKKSKYKPKK